MGVLNANFKINSVFKSFKKYLFKMLATTMTVEVQIVSDIISSMKNNWSAVANWKNWK